MPPKGIELHCECPRCGKSAYHTIRWLQENTSLKCAGCDNVMSSLEILRENSNAVRNSHDAERRASGN